MRTAAIAYPLEDQQGWERSLMAFLVEKERRSGSQRTVEGYSRMLQDFFGRLGKTPDEVTGQDVFVWAHAPGLSGKDPSPVTIGARMACVSSFFRFLIRMEIVDRNPCDRLERPRTSPSPPRGLSAEETRRLLAVIPDTRIGLRNRAILLTLLLTGRRRAEVFRLTRGDLSFDGDVCFYSLPGQGWEDRSARATCARSRGAQSRATGTGPGPGGDGSAPESLWGVTSGTFYAQLQRHFRDAGLPPAGIHILRHTAAKLRRDAGESIEDVSRFLDHTSLAVTTTYLRRLEGQEDHGWGRVAEAIGVG